MSQRTIIDGSGRTWICDEVDAPTHGAPADGSAAARREGADVTLSCTTASVADPVTLTVGWGWEKMSSNGLARMVSQAVPSTRE